MADRVPRTRRHLLPVAAVLLGATVYWPAVLDRELASLWGAGLGLWFVTAGAIAQARRPDNHTGSIMVFVGLCWFVGQLDAHRNPIAWTVGTAAMFLWIVPLAHLLYSFPRGVLPSRFAKLAVAAIALEAVGSQTLVAAFITPENYGCTGCPDTLNLLLIRDDLATVGAIVRLLTPIDFALLGSTAGMLAVRWRRSTGLQRHAVGPVLVTGLVGLSAYVVVLAATNFGVLGNLAGAATNVAVVTLWACPAAFLMGLLRSRARRARVSDLVVDLDAVSDQEAFQSALGRTLGDPSLVLGVWARDAGTYLTPAGEVLDLPDGAGRTDRSGSRAVTYLETNGEPLAVLIHDDALLEDPELVNGVAAAARLAVENDRLQAEIRGQLEEVRASRKRIVQAADDERRRVERDLHDGAQQRLVSLSLILGRARAKLADTPDPNPDLAATLDVAAKELEQALTELRELARGIHPQLLAGEGLGAALESLADRSSICVTLHNGLSGRLPAPVEAAGYFVVSEAITNATKHAGPNAVRIDVRVAPGLTGEELAITVEDDGIGGARIEDGGGLRGLLDRVHALSGSLEVDSPAGGGTRLRARIPCGQSDADEHDAAGSVGRS